MQEMTMSAGGSRARYATTPCAWCIIHRPGHAPNMIPATVPGSHGACDFCVQAMKDEFRRGRTADLGK